MKKSFIKIITAVTALSLSLLLFGCNDNSNQTSSSQGTTEQTTAVEKVEEFDISKLHTADETSGDSFAGVWNITDGEGSQYSSFDFIFNGRGKAVLALDNYGFCSDYTLSEEKFSCNLMYGINGSYTFKISDDKSTIVLTSDDTSETTTITRAEKSNLVPNAPENPKIDENLLGAWMSENGELYYFDKRGILYHNQYGTMFNYATYSAENGEVKSTYLMETETEEDFKYSINGDTLVIDSFEYKKTTTDEVTDFLAK